MAAYQKIDFHTHLESGRQAEELLLSMQQTDVTLSVILPVVTSPEQFQRINNHAAEINRTYPGKLLSFGSIHPLSQQYKQELNYIRSLGLPGIKLHPDRQKTAIDHKGYLHIIDYAQSWDSLLWYMQAFLPGSSCLCIAHRSLQPLCWKRCDRKDLC